VYDCCTNLIIYRRRDPLRLSDRCRREQQYRKLSREPHGEYWFTSKVVPPARPHSIKMCLQRSHNEQSSCLSESMSKEKQCSTSQK